MKFLEYFSRHVAYPLWDLRDKSVRLKEYRALIRQQWDKSDTRSQRQLERLNAIVQYAVKNVPFYRDAFGGAGSFPEFRDISELSRLPILTKADIRQNSDRLISDEFDKETLVSAKTGGSTGTSLEVFFDEECQQRRNAAAMMSDSWSGWRPGMEVAGLWGSPPEPKSLRAWLRNKLHDRIFYLDTMNLNHQTMSTFNDQIHQRKPGALFGHAHSIYEFAKFLKDQRKNIHHFDAIVTTSMMLLDPHRKVIESVFQHKVSDRYGCEEVGLIASECEYHEGLHTNEEHIAVEILNDNDEPVGLGEEGRLIVTDLINRGMPLIRYEVGDVASYIESTCSCGRNGRRLTKVLGRTSDYLCLPSGGKVSGISLVERTLTAIKGIEQLQIVQHNLGAYTLNVVPEELFSTMEQRQLENVVKEIFGMDVNINTVLIDVLPKTQRGKSQFAVCEIS